MPWMECGRAYGSSETGHLAAQIKSDRDAVYDGYNQPGGRLEIEIFKEPGVVAEEGEIGEVATRGAHLMTGYIENDDANTEFFKSDTTDGQWGWMGDLAVKHEAYFSLAGRSKHMILSGGLNSFPAELEEILSGHPAVSDCAVFGVDDPTWGELPCAAVVANDEDAEAEDIKIFVADQVARYKRIRRIYFVDQIPRTAAGKIRVFLVKEKCLG
jgi:acyl-CoA synthetase (AMP-forming)/AMP-acid ligase II